MKRPILLMLVAGVAISVMLVGCEKKKSPEKPAVEEKAETKKPEAKKPTVEKPAPKPADEKPAPKPADEKPAPKPAVKKPAPKPAPKPTAKKSDKIKGPWSEAEVGWIVVYKTQGGVKSKMEVVKVEEETITLRTTTIGPDGKVLGEPIEMQRDRYDVVKPGSRGKVKAKRVLVGAETLTVGGKELECKVWEITTESGGKKINFKSWECEEVPGWSVKSANDMSGEMRVSMELVEYKK